MHLPEVVLALQRLFLLLLNH